MRVILALPKPTMTIGSALQEQWKREEVVAQRNGHIFSYMVHFMAISSLPCEGYVTSGAVTKQQLRFLSLEWQTM
jgi:hypothetical protein